MKHVWRALPLILLLALSAGVISPIQAQDDGFPRMVIDLTGRPVTLPARPQIVAVIGDDPALAQVIPAASLRWIDPGGDVSRFDWIGVGLLVTPDLYAAAYPALIASAQAAGVPVFQTVPITDLALWQQAVRLFGQAAGCEDRAERVINRLDRRLAAVRAWVNQESGDPLTRVLILTPEGYTFGRGTLITDLIAAAGGINTTAEAGFSDYRQIDDPTIRALAPEVILLSPAWSAGDQALFITNPAYFSVPAVHNGRVYRLWFSPTQPRDPGWTVVFLAILLRR